MPILKLQPDLLESKIHKAIGADVVPLALDAVGAPVKRFFDIRRDIAYALDPTTHDTAGQDRDPISSQWIFDLGPVELVYVPAVLAQMQEFFAWTEQHQVHFSFLRFTFSCFDRICAAPIKACNQHLQIISRTTRAQTSLDLLTKFNHN